jgi:hypothetical protein
MAEDLVISAKKAVELGRISGPLKELMVIFQIDYYLENAA